MKSEIIIVDAFERFIKINGHRHVRKSNASTQRCAKTNLNRMK